VTDRGRFTVGDKVVIMANAYDHQAACMIRPSQRFQGCCGTIIAARSIVSDVIFTVELTGAVEVGYARPAMPSEWMFDASELAHAD